MDPAIIQFFSEEIDFELGHHEQRSSWLHEVAHTEGASISFLNYVFCSDEYLLEMNRQYLEHDTYTDIITFPYSESSDTIEGDIFISIDRVRENALLFEVTFEHELSRVMVHGLLHLLGYSDKSDEEQAAMRAKEDKYISLFT